MIVYIMVTCTPTVKKRNHGGADEPRTKIPRIDSKHLHVALSPVSLIFLQCKNRGDWGRGYLHVYVATVYLVFYNHCLPREGPVQLRTIDCEIFFVKIFH